jgi:hypothetical protein
MVAAELGWLLILWVLWLATAATTSTVNATLITHDCSRYSGALYF